jgi:hypothetical protein
VSATHSRFSAAALAVVILAGCAAQPARLLPGAGNSIAAGSAPARARASAATSGSCEFRSAPQPVSVAFCDTFAHPDRIGNRSGNADGTLWGVSRMPGYTNFGQGQFNAASPTVMDRCGHDVHVVPPNDVAICGGMLVDAVTDNGTVTSLAMYPKQPFDIAGRTGTIVFDVSDDSQGTHRVWPELWYTDHPSPVPFVHFSSLQSTPQNGFGVRFAAFCPPNVPGCGVRFICTDEPMNAGVVTVDSAVVVNNYLSNDSAGTPAGTLSVRAVGCVKASSGPGDLNHFELRVSQHEIDVYGTDAGKTAPVKKIAVISNMSLGLTRGLVWLEDAHYNANKAGFGAYQGTHTFTWGNVGFDGPVLPRDLAFDVLDRLQPIAGGLLNLGWGIVPGDAPLALHADGVYNVADASAAFVTLNYSTANKVTLSYRLNGGAWLAQPWPFGACYVQNSSTACGQKTIALSVPLSQVRSGTNTIEFKSTDATAIYNVDLILKGAAGIHNPAGTQVER